MLLFIPMSTAYLRQLVTIVHPRDYWYERTWHRLVWKGCLDMTRTCEFSVRIWRIVPVNTYNIILCNNQISGRISQIQHGGILTANDINLTPNVTINSIQLTLLGFPFQFSTLNQCNKCYYENHVLVVTMYGLWHRSLDVFLQESNSLWFLCQNG